MLCCGTGAASLSKGGRFRVRNFGAKRRPPGNRAAFSLGRIVRTEAKPSELSGEILSLAKYGVKAKTGVLQLFAALILRNGAGTGLSSSTFAFSSYPRGVVRHPAPRNERLRKQPAPELVQRAPTPPPPYALPLHRVCGRRCRDGETRVRWLPACPSGREPRHDRNPEKRPEEWPRGRRLH